MSVSSCGACAIDIRMFWFGLRLTKTVLIDDVTDRKYWEARSNSQSIAVMDSIAEIARPVAQPKPTYNKGHIAIGTSGRNFMWRYPRKGAHLLIRLRVDDDRDNLIEKFEEQGIEYRKGVRPYIARINLKIKELEQNKELLIETIRIAESYSH